MLVDGGRIRFEFATSGQGNFESGKKKLRIRGRGLRSFWKFHVVVGQNNGKEMYKKVCFTCKVAFLLIRPIVVFTPFSLPSPLSITRFYILFEKTLNIIESFAFSPG